MSSPHLSLRDFTFRVLVVIALAAFALFLWRIVDVLLLVFGATLAALVLHAIADPIDRRTGIGQRASLMLAVAMVVALIALAGWLFGREISAQTTELLDRIPRAWESIRSYLREYEIGRLLLEGLKGSSAQLGAFAAKLPQAAAMVSGGALQLLIVAFGGVYLAINPRVYRSGFLKLFPEAARDHVGDVVDSSALALRLWLRGQLITMGIVGAMTGLGLWLVGVPAPLALGLLAGLLEFIPYIGPILAAVPGVLLALTIGPDVLVYTVLVYVVVQQLEGNLVLPIVQRQVLKLPPALVIFSVVALGLTFGTLGWILAAPLTVLLMVVIGKLYVRETLSTEARIPGEPAPEPRE